MDTGMMVGWAGGILGCVIGLAGGIFGTCCGIKNTQGPRERAFMVKASVVCWAAVILFLGLMFALPKPYCHLLWIPYAILLPVGVVFSNRSQQRIRREESQAQGNEV